MMNYEETCAYLKTLDRLGSIPGLENITELLKRLGNPEQNTRFVHIAGTNGKGSVGAFVTSVLVHAGFRTGRYLSPAVEDELEIIQYNGLNIKKDEFAGIIGKIKEVCDEMRKEGLLHPTRFEVETAAAFMYFNIKKCDIAVVECGMGGLLDATNVIQNTECAVITPISLEHTAFLGNTVEKIAAHKAGIIKPEAEVVYAAKDESLNLIIEEKAVKLGCNATAVKSGKICREIGEGQIVIDFDAYPGAAIKLMGIYQIENAALAVECILALKRKGFAIPDTAVYDGLYDAKWFGRFEKIGRNPDFIIDGAHNPAGAAALSESLKTYYPQGGLTFIAGFFADKDYKTVLEYLMPMASTVFTVSTPGNPRALSAKTLAEYIKKYYDVDVFVQSCDTIEEAVGLALSVTDESGAVIAFGSLSHLSYIYKEYCRRIEV